MSYVCSNTTSNTIRRDGDSFFDSFNITSSLFLWESSRLSTVLAPPHYAPPRWGFGYGYGHGYRSD